MELILAIAFSQHLGMDGNYNSVHPHLQLQHDSGFVAGAYLNSESTVSAYGGYRFEYDDAFLEVGGVTGYTSITVAPYLRAGYEIRDGVDLFVAPAFEYNNGGDLKMGAVVGVSFNF
jgi:hypothetical protein